MFNPIKAIRFLVCAIVAINVGIAFAQDINFKNTYSSNCDSEDAIVRRWVDDGNGNIYLYTLAKKLQKVKAERVAFMLPKSNAMVMFSYSNKLEEVIDFRSAMSIRIVEASLNGNAYVKNGLLVNINKPYPSLNKCDDMNGLAFLRLDDAIAELNVEEKKVADEKRIVEEKRIAEEKRLEEYKKSPAYKKEQAIELARVKKEEADKQQAILKEQAIAAEKFKRIWTKPFAFNCSMEDDIEMFVVKNNQLKQHELYSEKEPKKIYEVTNVVFGANDVVSITETYLNGEPITTDYKIFEDGLQIYNSNYIENGVYKKTKKTVPLQKICTKDSKGFQLTERRNPSDEFSKLTKAPGDFAIVFGVHPNSKQGKILLYSKKYNIAIRSIYYEVEDGFHSSVIKGDLNNFEIYSEYIKNVDAQKDEVTIQMVKGDKYVIDRATLDVVYLQKYSGADTQKTPYLIYHNQGKVLGDEVFKKLIGQILALRDKEPKRSPNKF